jgi:hypothetical protein
VEFLPFHCKEEEEEEEDEEEAALSETNCRRRLNQVPAEKVALVWVECNGYFFIYFLY